MTLSLCLPFYKNRGMLAEQYRVWAGYPAALKASIEIVVVDDGSPVGERAEEVVRPACLPPCRLFRALDDVPWHQHGARNLAADQAEGDWLLMTDMDHVVPAESLSVLLARIASAAPDDVFMFRRLDAPDLTPKLKNGQPHPHTNTYATTKARYWAIGGYDEDCAGYGTDSFFLKKLKAPGVTLLEGAPIVRYARDVIPDASTRAPAGVDPKVFRDQARQTQMNQRVIAMKAERGLPPSVLQFAWERVA